MPELPDVTVYIEALERRIVGDTLGAVRVRGPSLLRTAVPPLSATHGKRVLGLSRIGKRIVISLEAELHLVIHLMIAGRFRWKEPGAGIPGKVGLAAFDFAKGTLILTEASTKKRATLHVVKGAEALQALDPGGIEVLMASRTAFASALRAQNRTLKRALTDPHILSGIGNAYSDEILHDAQLSPVTLTQRLPEEALDRLHASCHAVLERFTEALRTEVGDDFPTKVTAFRPDMAVHGRHKEACPRCGGSVQRIVHGKHETNYCPKCQTGGKLLADRALSRLLKRDWPKTPTELEERIATKRLDEPPSAKP